MDIESEKRSDKGLLGQDGISCTKSTALLAGAVAASSGMPGIISKSDHKGRVAGQIMIHLRYLTVICILRLTREKNGNGIR